MTKEERKRRAKLGWINWYINRGRLPLNPTKRDLRALSWRRTK
jgi:hypothetical protein